MNNRHLVFKHKQLPSAINMACFRAAHAVQALVATPADRHDRQAVLTHICGDGIDVLVCHSDVAGVSLGQALVINLGAVQLVTGNRHAREDLLHSLACRGNDALVGGSQTGDSTGAAQSCHTGMGKGHQAGQRDCC